MTISVREAFAACGEDEAEFAGLIDEIAVGAAKYYGAELGDLDVAASLIGDDVEALLQADGAEKLTQAVMRVISAQVKHEPIADGTVSAYNQVRDCADTSTLCHAPSSSLYFGRNGYVTACCYSRSNPVGRWPRQSVEEIWFGPKIKHLDEQIRHNVLPMGCDTCADQLRAHNFNGLLARGFDRGIEAPNNTALAKLTRLFRSPKPAYPTRLEFELSNKCNLECDMCSGAFSSSIRANRENKPPLAQVYDSRFVAELRPFIPHLKQAKFLGGEPFLIDLYYEIWELFIELNPDCQITITTNGTVFTPKVQRMLEKLNFQLVLSLDSVNKPTYEAIRRNATLERTLDHLARYREILVPRGKSITMAVCPMRLNWRELSGTGLICERWGDEHLFQYCHLPGERFAEVSAAVGVGGGCGLFTAGRGARSRCVGRTELCGAERSLAAA